MSDTIPVAQLRAFVERIERIEADIKDLNGDKSEVYKELRGCGFDVKAVRAVVAKRKLDTADREERDAMFDLYWSALNGEDRARAHAREIIEEFDAETGEITDNQEHETEVTTSRPEAAANSAADIDTPATGNDFADDVGATASSTNFEQPDTAQPAPMVVYGDSVAGRRPLQASLSTFHPEDNQEGEGVDPDLPSSATHSHSQASPPPADSAGEAPSSSPASPATHSDDIDLTIPDFLRRTEGGYPNREAVDV